MKNLYIITCYLKQTPMKLYIILLCILFCNITTAAPSHTDTLTTAEIQQLEAGLMKGSFKALFMADSFSARKDTLHTGEWFMKIDPYYFFWIYGETANTDTIFRRYRLSAEVKAAYKEKYLAVLNTPRTEAYMMMKKMRDADQDIRRKSETCGDSFTCALINRKMRMVDSTNFTQLYQYTLANGWPGTADGSLYAAIIAIHDGSHKAHYIPLIKQAILNGQLPLEPLRLMMYKAQGYETYEALQQRLDTSVKFSFDVSTLISNTVPGNLERMKKVIKQYCPDIEVLLVYEASAKNSKHEGWWNKEKSMMGNKDGGPVSYFMHELSLSCPKKIRGDIWMVHYLPSTKTSDRMMLYVILRKKK